MLRNPYAKVHNQKKRQERPWDCSIQENSKPIPKNVQSVKDDGTSFETDFDWDKAEQELYGVDCSFATTSDDDRLENVVTNLANHCGYQLNRFPAIDVTALKVGIPINQINAQTNEIVVTKQNGILSLRPQSWTEKIRNVSSGNCPPTDNDNLLSMSSPSKDSDPRQASLPAPLRFDPKVVEPINDDKRRLLVKYAALSEPLLNGWTLFPHQKRAILSGLLMRRMILALDMGMGKTLIGCVWSKAFSKAFESIKIVIICPVSLKETWHRSVHDCTGLTVQGAGSQPDKESDVFIASWSKIPSIEEIRGSEYQNFVVVADEAHSMQNIQSARTQDALKLMHTPTCVGVILLTGTPMKNGKPSNLFPLLHAVRHPLANHQRSYEAHFCGGRDVNFGNGRNVWQATGCSNLTQLRELTKSHLLYLTKEDCLKEIPAQTRIRKHVPVSCRSRLQHVQALQQLAKIYSNSDGGNQKNYDAILGAVQNLRVIGSLSKVDATAEIAIKILEEEEAVVIFTSFKQVAINLCKKLSDAGWQSGLLTGDTLAKKRQGIVDNFQNGLTPVFVCTFGAGGVGLTLTAAHTVILLDRPWTPGDACQAEDRVRRIGQTKAVKSIWISAFELDDQIDAILEQKSQNASTVLCEAKSNQQSNVPVPQQLSIFKLLKSVLEPQLTTLISGGSPTNSIFKQTSILEYSQAGIGESNPGG